MYGFPETTLANRTLHGPGRHRCSELDEGTRKVTHLLTRVRSDGRRFFYFFNSNGCKSTCALRGFSIFLHGLLLSHALCISFLNFINLLKVFSVKKLKLKYYLKKKNWNYYSKCLKMSTLNIFYKLFFFLKKKIIMFRWFRFS